MAYIFSVGNAEKREGGSDLFEFQGGCRPAGK
jgi:hypothetical protein